jgi:hypothetical protein
VVRQPVEQRGGHLGVTEHRRPLQEREVVVSMTSLREFGGLGPIDIQDSNCRRDVIHEFPESILELVGWPGGMN